MKAIIKLNSGRGALLCNRCRTILREGRLALLSEDREHFCEEFGKECRKEVENDNTDQPGWDDPKSDHR
jgi:hypothetical protein